MTRGRHLSVDDYDISQYMSNREISEWRSCVYTRRVKFRQKIWYTKELGRVLAPRIHLQQSPVDRSLYQAQTSTKPVFLHSICELCDCIPMSQAELHRPTGPDSEDPLCRSDMIVHTITGNYASVPRSCRITSYLHGISIHAFFSGNRDHRNCVPTHIPNMIAALGTTRSKCGVKPPYRPAMPSSRKMVPKHCTRPVYLSRPPCSGACLMRVRTTSCG